MLLAAAGVPSRAARDGRLGLAGARARRERASTIVTRVVSTSASIGHLNSKASAYEREAHPFLNNRVTFVICASDYRRGSDSTCCSYRAAERRDIENSPLDGR